MLEKYYARVTLLLIILALTGCGKIVTLYRDSVAIAGARYVVAVFDGDGMNLAGNRENCNVAAHLFMSQPGVKTKFWCEG